VGEQTVGLMNEVDDALWHAVCNARLEDVKALAARASFNLSNLEGNNLWYEAIWADEEDVVKLLIDSGTDLNGLDKHGRSPIFWAAGLGRLKSLSLLLEAGATFDPPVGSAGVIPLHGARAKAIPLLASHGANLDAVNEDGQTALHCAAWDLDADRVRALLAAGAHPLPINEDGDTPLDIAALRRDWQPYRWERTMEALAPSIAEQQRQALDTATAAAAATKPRRGGL
jgi:ankyrin repeat protein